MHNMVKDIEEGEPSSRYFNRLLSVIPTWDSVKITVKYDLL